MAAIARLSREEIRRPASSPAAPASPPAGRLGERATDFQGELGAEPGAAASPSEQLVSASRLKKSSSAAARANVIGPRLPATVPPLAQ